MNLYRLSRLVPKSLRGLIRLLLDRIPVRIEVRRARPKWLGENDRFIYQGHYVNFNVGPNDRVLDVGSGEHPFPYATVFVDRFLKPSRHRHAPLVRSGKPLVVADIQNLPFRDKCCDFVFCSHVLEHVDDPLKACAEIMRVGKRGYIETPTMGKDVLFAHARNMHRWYLTAIGRNLCFYEYSERQLDGIGSRAWRELISSKWYHPLQKAFYENQDLFNVMFTWFDSFTVFVFRLDDTIETLNAEIRYCRRKGSVFRGITFNETLQDRQNS